MGFNYFDIGQIHPCGIANKQVYQKLPSGKVISYPTGLDITVPEQLNLFISDCIAFVLYDNENEYIGRFDGTISIYRKSDDLLVGLNFWTAPKVPNVIPCGYLYNGKIHSDIFLFLDDGQTVATADSRYESILTKPTSNREFDFDKAMLGCLTATKPRTPCIYDKGGHVYETGSWNVQTDLWKQNCKIFL